MRFLRRDTREPSINLAPLIDIVFLLLIFIVVSSRFVDRRGLTLELPAAASATATANAPRIEVRVAADGRYRVDGQVVTGDLLAAALQRMRARYPERALRVRADASARHAAVVRVLDAAAGAGFARVDIAARAAR